MKNEKDIQETTRLLPKEATTPPIPTEKPSLTTQTFRKPLTLDDLAKESDTNSKKLGTDYEERLKKLEKDYDTSEANQIELFQKNREERKKNLDNKKQELRKEFDKKKQLLEIQLKKKTAFNKEAIPSIEERNELLTALKKEPWSLQDYPTLRKFLAYSCCFTCLPQSRYNENLANKYEGNFNKPFPSNFVKLVAKDLQTSENSIANGAALQTALIEHAIDLNPERMERWNEISFRNEEGNFQNIPCFLSHNRFTLAVLARDYYDFHNRNNNPQYSFDLIEKLAITYQNFYGVSAVSIEYDDTHPHNREWRYVHFDRELLLNEILPVMAGMKEIPSQKNSVSRINVPDDVLQVSGKHPGWVK